MIRVRINKGVSLVEIILSIAILSLLSVYIIQMFILSKKLNSEAEDLDKSVYLSESIFEMIEREEPFNPEVMFQHVRVQESAMGSEIEVFFDSDWNVTDTAQDKGYVLTLSISEIQALSYTKFDYFIEVDKIENREMERIYEIGMQKYR